MDAELESTLFQPELGGDALFDAVEPPPPAVIEIRHFSFHYGETQALDNISMEIPRRRVTAFIGPSGCGKTTLLRAINRINDLIPRTRHAGDILLAGRSLFDRRINLIRLRRAVGMVFQKSNPFPRSVYENVAYGVRLAGVRQRRELDRIVEESLLQAALWDEVKDRLHHHALSLSGGQMQRLCIARAIACKPQVLLMDEPCSALDPIATERIEELIFELKRKYTIVLVTHSMPQAARCSEYLGFFSQGKLIEFGSTPHVFSRPAEQKTEEYLMGRHGEPRSRLEQR